MARIPAKDRGVAIEIASIEGVLIVETERREEKGIKIIEIIEII